MRPFARSGVHGAAAHGIAQQSGEGDARTGESHRFKAAEAEALHLRCEHANVGRLQVELAGADGIYHPAQAEVMDQDVQVISAVVPRPVWVRYAWGNNPPAALFNGEHLPASPFVERVL